MCARGLNRRWQRGRLKAEAALEYVVREPFLDRAVIKGEAAVAALDGRRDR
jgi:hypothetical protein